MASGCWFCLALRDIVHMPPRALLIVRGLGCPALRELGQRPLRPVHGIRVSSAVATCTASRLKRCPVVNRLLPNVDVFHSDILVLDAKRLRGVKLRSRPVSGGRARRPSRAAT